VVRDYSSVVRAARAMGLTGQLLSALRATE
jgi:hypothetical protein